MFDLEQRLSSLFVGRAGGRDRSLCAKRMNQRTGEMEGIAAVLTPCC